MGLDGVAPLQSGLIVPPQPEPDPPEGDPEKEGGGKANGVVRKLQSDHFKGKGVSDVRLRIAHFENPGLERVLPDEPMPVPEDGASKAEDGASKAYEKFLAQYRALYNASQPSESEELVAETPPEPVEPVAVTPPAPEGPVAETPPDPVDPVAETPPEPVSVIVTPLEIELIPASGQTEPEEPVDEGDGALAAFDALLDAQASQEEPEALDVVM